MSSNAAPESGFICLKPLYDFIRKHKREYLQALNTGFLVVLLVIVGFVALLLSTAHLPVVNQRGLCIILAKINLQAQTTFLVKLPLLVDLPCPQPKTRQNLRRGNRGVGIALTDRLSIGSVRIVSDAQNIVR